MKTSGLLAKAPFDALEKRAFLASKYLVHNFRALSQKAKEKTTVIIAGHQRSGSNMLMDVLERSYETDVYHERDSRAFENYQMRDIPSIRSLHNASQSPCFVIKALCELQELPELMAAFSPASTVWLIRDYRDVVNSAVRSFPGLREICLPPGRQPGGGRLAGPGYVAGNPKDRSFPGQAGNLLNLGSRSAVVCSQYAVLRARPGSQPQGIAGFLRGLGCKSTGRVCGDIRFPRPHVCPMDGEEYIQLFHRENSGPGY
jgi:hypothetical protein